MKLLSVAAMAAALVGIGQAAEQVAKESGDWSGITWSPGPAPAAADIVHIEGGFTVNYAGASSPNFSRLYVGDNTGGFASADGTLEVSGGVLTVNANAAGAFLVGRSDGSNGVIKVTGGVLRGIGANNGAGMQIGFGATSTGSVTITGGELQLASGVILGSGDNSTGHFVVSDGTVTVAGNVDGGSFNVGGRVPGSSTTATYFQSGGSVTVANNFFRVGYAGGANQMMNASAHITGGTFSGNVLIGRQSSLKSGGGYGGTLTIGADANVSGRDQAWEVSGNGEIIFALGKDASFQAVDLTRASVDSALVLSQKGARITVDGKALAFSSGYKPISLILFAEGKGPADLSKANVEFDYTGFDKRFAPELVWTGTSLQLKVR